ncbi:AAA family ATPase [Streptomyces sp. NPDC005808]|uniref:AAA family ATPase n=1 Tax=Streptomyces sp. NPDC005808 TaxID=3364734 RepID=UPI0036ACCA42
MPSSSLRERREALALIAAEAERARSGTGRLVLLRGATGTGRTTLLEAAAEHAAGHGMRVLRVRCSPEGTGAPFAAVHQLLGVPVESASDLVPEFASGSTEPGGEADETGRAIALWKLLRSSAADGPLLIAVDDVHHADPPSRRWLAETARRLDHLPVLLLATERSQYDVDPPSPGLVHALSPALVRIHTLAPLDADSGAELVRSALADAWGGPSTPSPLPPPPPSPEWVADCVRASAGSPLLLRALLDDVGNQTSAPLPETCAALYPGAYPAAVSWWLDSAGPATAEAARVLAALDDVPEGGDAELLAETAGADPERVRGWLTAMTRLGLLCPDAAGRPRYAHPLLRDAVLTGLPAARRQAAHRAAGELLLRRGDPAEAVARQLLKSGTVGEAWATDALLDAAAGAVRDGRTDEALVLLRHALAEPMSSARRAEVLTELGSLEFAAVLSSSGIPRLTEAMRLPDLPQHRVQAAVALGTVLARRGEAHAAFDLLRNLKGQLTDHPDLLRTVQTASALLADHDQTIRQTVYRWLRETAESSPHLLGPTGFALLIRYEATAGLASAATAMKQVRVLLAEPTDPLAEPYLLGTAAAVAQWADELDEAQRLVERGLAGQRPSLLHPMHAALLNVRADIAAARGEFGELLAGAWDGERERSRGKGQGEGDKGGVCPGGAPWAGEGASPRNGPTNTQAHILLALVETGRTTEATRLADGLDLREAHDSWELNRFLYARGVVRAAAGDHAGALGDFLGCGRRQSARDVVSPVVTPWRTAAAECRVALARPREALALAEEELRLAQVWNTPRLVGRSLRVLGRATGGHRGLALAEESVRVLRDTPAVTELILALLAQARQLTESGERTRARDLLREAADHAKRLGVVRLRTLAEASLREGGARRTTTTTLTASEHRIAALAADGRTNTEISELLHLARRTVETHLTGAYRKLGVRGRGELGGVLGRVKTSPDASP